MPQLLNVEKQLSQMLAKQESLLSALQSLAETHAGDCEGKTRTKLMTWASTLEALEDAREALDDLIETVHYAAVAEAEDKVSGRGRTDVVLELSPRTKVEGSQGSPNFATPVGCLRQMGAQLTGVTATRI
jgi:hypothetical protein